MFEIMKIGGLSALNDLEHVAEIDDLSDVLKVA